MTLLELNRTGRFLMPNAWDVASARVLEEAGFAAIGTTSAGIAYARGFGDAQRISREAMVREIAAITAGVRVPVNADIEAGYGPAPADVAETTAAVLDAGVAGVNLEDSAHGGAAGVLFDIREQAARIAAARARAEAMRIPLVITARVDVFFNGCGASGDERLALTIERGRAYLDAGADVIFVPLLLDLAAVRRLADTLPAPIALMAGPGAPPAPTLFDAGASRVSLGPSAMLATLGTLRDIAAEIRTSGTWSTIEQRFYPFGEAEALFARS